MWCFTRGCYRSDNGVSINGIVPNGTFLTLYLLMVRWHTSQERQNLMTSWHSPGQKKFGSILTSVSFGPKCPLNADSWFTDITYLRGSLGTTNCLVTYLAMSFPCKPINIFCFLIQSLVDLSVGSIPITSAGECWKTSIH